MMQNKRSLFLKKYIIIFSVFLIAMCCLAAVSAEEIDGQLNASDDSAESAIEEEDIISTETAEEALQNQDNATPEDTRTDLNIETDTNVIKKGGTYNMQLTDSKGHAVASKKLTVNSKAENFTKTTDNAGKFSIKISDSSSQTVLNVTFKGDETYKPFSRLITVYIVETMPVTVGNAKLLTNGYLRVYLHGSKKAVASKKVKITIGGKTFESQSSKEGFVVIKPGLSAKTYTVVVEYDRYRISKTVKCIKGNVKDPLKASIALVNGAPDIDVMPAKYVMGDGDATYTLTKAQYQEAIKRDSYCIYLYGKMSKYTFFKTKDCPDTYHILKRQKWNVIERQLNTMLVKKNKYSYWPKTITVSLKGKSYTYSEVRDVQNTEYTCGPTSASVCSQALKNYYSEKFFQTKAHVTHGVNIDVLKRAIDSNGFKSSYYHSVNAGVNQLKKGGCALIAYLPNHYVAVIDVSKDGKKILVSNSYGKYDVGGDSRVPTKWVSVKYFKTKFRGVGLVVKLNYKLTKNDKKTVKNFYNSMGTKYQRQNTNERIPNT